jgi:hypothetical protein
VIVTFGGVVSEVRGEIPAIPLGTFVSGRFVYDLDVVDSSTGASPIIDLLISAGDVTFTASDLLESRVREFVGTAGFSVLALLRGDLGDLSEGVFFGVFAEFEFFNFGLSGATTDAAAFGALSYLQFEDASTAIPEPPTLLMLSTLLVCVVGTQLRRQVAFRKTSPRINGFPQGESSEHRRNRLFTKDLSRLLVVSHSDELGMP